MEGRRGVGQRPQVGVGTRPRCGGGGAREGEDRTKTGAGACAERGTAQSYRAAQLQQGGEGTGRGGGLRPACNCVLPAAGEDTWLRSDKPGPRPRLSDHARLLVQLLHQLCHAADHDAALALGGLHHLAAGEEARGRRARRARPHGARAETRERAPPAASWEPVAPSPGLPAPTSSVSCAGAASTPSSSAVSPSMGFFLAFMMLGSVAYLWEAGQGWGGRGRVGGGGGANSCRRLAQRRGASGARRQRQAQRHDPPRLVEAQVGGDDRGQWRAQRLQPAVDLARHRHAPRGGVERDPGGKRGLRPLEQPRQHLALRGGW
jgi:hypothetical protein